MKIAIPKERREFERRVAASPDSVKKLVALDAEVSVESGAGAGASIGDAAFAEAGAAIAATGAAALEGADVVFKVQSPLASEPDEVGLMKKGALLIGLLAPTAEPGLAAAYAARGLTAVALEFLPRISRAQGMDALSSQSNLAGYKAVLDASVEYGRALPMMMTAAGTIAPARVLILGAGVAGLQSIATARRLGAIVAAFDVRAAVKEQVESLGARFIEVPALDETAEGEDGYARDMGEDYRRRQIEIIHQTLRTTDIAICTALIPGKPAPILITEAMVAYMRPGSVIVDLAVAMGGNCSASRPGETTEVSGVKVIAHHNVPSRIAGDASALYARNLFNFLAPLIQDGELSLDFDDEILAATVLTREGAIVHPSLAEQP